MIMKLKMNLILKEENFKKPKRNTATHGPTKTIAITYPTCAHGALQLTTNTKRTVTTLITLRHSHLKYTNAPKLPHLQLMKMPKRATLT